MLSEVLRFFEGINGGSRQHKSPIKLISIFLQKVVRQSATLSLLSIATCFNTTTKTTLVNFCTLLFRIMSSKFIKKQVIFSNLFSRVWEELDYFTGFQCAALTKHIPNKNCFHC
jgi:hypothetical protein